MRSSLIANKNSAFLLVLLFIGHNFRYIVVRERKIKQLSERKKNLTRSSKKRGISATNGPSCAITVFNSFRIAFTRL